MEDDNQQHLRYDEGDSSSDEVEVVGVLTFPQKVYDMVSRESLKAPDTVQWIQNGEAFALEHTDKLRNILKTYFGCKCVTVHVHVTLTC